MKDKILSTLEVFEEFVASFFFVIGSVVCLIGIFMRYVMNHPLVWTNEVFELLMVTAIFIGFGIALKDDQHIKVDLIYEKMPKSIKKVFNIISNLLGAIFSIYLAVMGVEMVSVAHDQMSISIDLGIPLWITYLAMPIGMGLLGIYFVVKTYRAILGKDLEEETTINIENLF
ncbi:hypothetical protein CSV69_14660 [Sporosarcina sp. P26b]|uniref:TRAP transporter small permease n=1 Tax=Sporosarcina sp. P26b TaxID=2048253 RepID=UPI000C1649A1|nr:TRAP transporter small permease [Sporosarcina sp. P26b]PIC94827.1 hypothetical protein CSV69_14660 [Sporosarcina sp. P26b]